MAKPPEVKSTFKSLPRSLRIAPAPKGGKKEIDVLSVEGADISDYVLACEQSKAAEGLKTELRPAILELGVPHIIRTNCGAETEKARIKSVKLMDENGSVLRVTFKNVYKDLNKSDMFTLFDELNAIREKEKRPGIDPGKYAAEVLFATFDSTVFRDAKGNFDQQNYAKYRSAIEKVAKELKQVCPLDTSSATVVKEAFYDARWSDFTVEENLRISKVFSNTVDCVAVDNMHTASHLIDQLAVKVDDATMTDEEFRQHVRELLAQKTAVLALDLQPVLPGVG